MKACASGVAGAVSPTDHRGALHARAGVNMTSSAPTAPPKIPENGFQVLEEHITRFNCMSEY